MHITLTLSLSPALRKDEFERETFSQKKWKATEIQMRMMPANIQPRVKYEFNNRNSIDWMNYWLMSWMLLVAHRIDAHNVHLICTLFIRILIKSLSMCFILFDDILLSCQIELSIHFPPRLNDIINAMSWIFFGLSTKAIALWTHTIHNTPANKDPFFSQCEQIKLHTSFNLSPHSNGMGPWRLSMWKYVCVCVCVRTIGRICKSYTKMCPLYKWTVAVSRNNKSIRIHLQSTTVTSTYWSIWNWSKCM